MIWWFALSLAAHADCTPPSQPTALILDMSIEDDQPPPVADLTSHAIALRRGSAEACTRCPPRLTVTLQMQPKTTTRQPLTISATGSASSRAACLKASSSLRRRSRAPRSRSSGISTQPSFAAPRSSP